MPARPFRSAWAETVDEWVRVESDPELLTCWHDQDDIHAAARRERVLLLQMRTGLSCQWIEATMDGPDVLWAVVMHAN